jgi:translation initiation factor 5B
VELGRVTSIEVNHKNVDKATTGQEVCIKIENMGGDAPKMYGRHFDHTDMLVSKVIYSHVKSFNFDSLLTLQR